MRRELELPLGLGLGESERLDLSQTLWIGTLSILAGLATFLFPFFQSPGEAGFRVDEAFSGITHRSRLSMANAQCSMPNAQDRSPMTKIRV
jgi:hypothetical protein